VLARSFLDSIEECAVKFYYMYTYKYSKSASGKSERNTSVRNFCEGKFLINRKDVAFMKSGDPMLFYRLNISIILRD
jgi:hypothetical protein